MFMWVLRATFLVFVLHHSSSETNSLIKWQILNPPIVFGQDVVLSCNASLAENCCTNTATWMKGLDVIVHHEASTDICKYIQEKQKYGFLLIIKNFDEDDINQQYTCLYDFYSYSAVLRIDRLNFKYIPNVDELKANINKTSDNILFADVSFLKVYPLPECILVANQKKIDTIVTVEEEAKIGLFYKMKLHLECEIHNKCMNRVAVLCTIGKHEMVVHNESLSTCPDINNSLGSDKNSLDCKILVEFIFSGLFLCATFITVLVLLLRKRQCSSRTSFSRIEGSVANSTRSENRCVRFWKKEDNGYDEEFEVTPFLEESDSGSVANSKRSENRCVKFWKKEDNGYGEEFEVTPFLEEDPSVWTTEHVQQWIDWAVKEYQLRSVDKSRFATLTGIELCTWTMEDFTQICGELNANCLLGHLNFLRRRIIQKTYPPSMPSPNGLSTINYNHNSGGSYVACKADKIRTLQSYGPAQTGKDVNDMINYAKRYDEDYEEKLFSDALINNARQQKSIPILKPCRCVPAPPCTNVSDVDVLKGSSWIPTWGVRKRSRISISSAVGR